MDGSALQVKLAVFEGPLELLLHLIEKHEVDVFDIPIHFITERFLDAMAAMERLDLQVGGEFLVMAATLAHIKSKLLLPRSEASRAEGEGEDPRAELVEQLVEYQRYKDLAAQLDERGTLGRDVFVRAAAERPAGGAGGESAHGERLLDLFELLQAFEQVKRRAGFRRRLDVTVARRSVGQEMRRIAQALAGREQISFWDLVEKDATGAPSIVSLVGAFLGLLELARRGLVRVHSGSDASELLIRPAVADVSLQLAENLGPGDEDEEGELPGA